jgi:hypothetical protein
MRKVLFASAFFLAVGLVAPKPVAADPILMTLQGVNDPSLTASVLMTYDTSLGQLSLAITNTSANFDPRLTGFGFNVPTNVTGLSSFSSNPAGWTYSYDPNDIDTPGQFGFYDTAALTGANLNGGTPNLGIPIGSTFTFAFRFTGSSLGSLNENSFVDLLAFDPPGGANESEQSFVARFQRVGASGQGSDVAIPTSIRNVPEPSTLFLSGLGFLGLAATLRRRFPSRS